MSNNTSEDPRHQRYTYKIPSNATLVQVISILNITQEFVVSPGLQEYDLVKSFGWKLTRYD